MYYDQVGKLAPLFGRLPLPAEHYYYHENAVANLVSLGKICEEFRVVFDFDVHDTFYIFNNDETYIVFDKTRNNLYCLSVFHGDVQECCFVTTVAGVEIEYSGLDRRRAKAVRSLQKRIGFPSDNNLANTIDYNVVGNCQFNRRDIRIANKIHGKSVAKLKEKLSKRKAKMFRIDMKRDVPKTIMDAYRKTHFNIDIMYVNKVAYLTAISEHIRMTNCIAIKGREKNRMSDAIERIIEQYNQRVSK